MKLQIWVTDESTSPDMNETIYVDITLRLDLTVAEMRVLALDLARVAHGRIAQAAIEAAIDMPKPKRASG